MPPNIIFDGAAREIRLPIINKIRVPDIYTAWVDWAQELDNLKFFAAFEVVAQPPTVPVYATLVNGWIVRPHGGSYTLTLSDGFLYHQNGDPIGPSYDGQEPRIRYQNPVIAVGYGAGGSFTDDDRNTMLSARDHARAANMQTQR